MLAEAWGDPRLSESGWDTARSISCWLEATMAGQRGPQSEATLRSLRVQQGRWSWGLGSGARLRLSLDRYRAVAGCRSQSRSSSHTHPSGTMSSFYMSVCSTHLHCNIDFTKGTWNRITSYLVKSHTLARALPMAPITRETQPSRPTPTGPGLTHLCFRCPTL